MGFGGAAPAETQPRRHSTVVTYARAPPDPDRPRGERQVEVLSGRTAVVTGAASGIGEGLAERFAAEGMNVVLADVEEEALAITAKELEAAGARVLAVPTDVSDRGSVDDLAGAATHAFGNVHVLCNNAGVAGGGIPIWATTANDWSWVLGVNLMGVVHGIQAFVPGMVAHGEEGHVVNTSSVLGLSGGNGSIYSVTKHGVARLTEGLWHDLRPAGSAVSASVLCPGLIATRIVSSDRNRPARLRDPDTDPAGSADRARMRETVQARFLADGMAPSDVASMVVDAIRSNRFWILTHPASIKPLVEQRLRSVLDDGPPAGGFGMGG